MELQLQGGSSAKVKVSDDTFGQDFREALVHQVVVACMASSRSGSAKQKTRSEARGGGTKPWRQKGTGRARAGTIRSPIWRGGGNAFAADPAGLCAEDQPQDVPCGDALDSLGTGPPGSPGCGKRFCCRCTEDEGLVDKLDALGVENALIITEEPDDNLYLAARNLPRVAVCDAAGADPVSLVGFDKVVITTAALKQLEERLA